MNKKMMVMVVAGLLAGGGGSAMAAGQSLGPDLSSDETTACEALMCLTAPGSPPHECNPSLRKYFSLHATKPSDLREKRRNFLNQCPSDSPDLVNSIVNGQCNAQYQDCAGPGGPDDPRRDPRDIQLR